MSEPERQHTVPACYLREFVDPKTPPNFEPYVWVFDKNGKNRKKKAPGNILVSPNLYTITLRGDERDYSIERTLSTIESDYAGILRQKIKNHLPLSESEHVSLCLFVATMLQRTESQKKNLEQFIDELIEFGKKLEQHHGVRSKNVRELEKYRVNAHRLSILDYLSDVTQLLFNMNVAFLFADKRGSFFITSDDPCTLFNPKLPRQGFWGPGLGQKDIEVILPLSPKITLCLSWSNLQGYIELKRAKIENINRLTRASSFKLFISCSPKAKWIWFRKYPVDVFFMAKVVRNWIKTKLRRLSLNDGR